MVSYSSSGSSSYSSRKVYRTEVFRGVLCSCGIEAPCKEAWKVGTADPGRRFYGCSRFQDPRLKCNFFMWADPPYTDRAREVIEEMKRKVAAKTDETWLLKDDLEIAEKVRKEREEALLKMAGEMEVKNNNMKKLWFLLILSWVIFIVALICNVNTTM